MDTIYNTQIFDAKIIVQNGKNNKNLDNLRENNDIKKLNTSIFNRLEKYTVPRGGGCISDYKVIQECNQTEEKEYALSEEQQIAFEKNYKIGIYKQLHKKGLLTDVQLNMVLKLQT